MSSLPKLFITVVTDGNPALVDARQAAVRNAGVLVEAVRISERRRGVSPEVGGPEVGGPEVGGQLTAPQADAVVLDEAFTHHGAHVQTMDATAGMYALLPVPRIYEMSDEQFFAKLCEEDDVLKMCCRTTWQGKNPVSPDARANFVRLFPTLSSFIAARMAHVNSRRLESLALRWEGMPSVMTGATIMDAPPADDTIVYLPSPHRGFFRWSEAPVVLREFGYSALNAILHEPGEEREEAHTRWLGHLDRMMETTGPNFAFGTRMAPLAVRRPALERLFGQWLTQYRQYLRDEGCLRDADRSTVWGCPEPLAWGVALQCVTACCGLLPQFEIADMVDSMPRVAEACEDIATLLGWFRDARMVKGPSGEPELPEIVPPLTDEEYKRVAKVCEGALVPIPDLTTVYRFSDLLTSDDLLSRARLVHASLLLEAARLRDGHFGPWEKARFTAQAHAMHCRVAKAMEGWRPRGALTKEG